MEKLKNGDLVRLKSGGPTMTVSQAMLDALAEGLAGDKRIRCQWFAGGKLQSGMFAAETLVSVDEEGETKAKAKQS